MNKLILLLSASISLLILGCTNAPTNPSSTSVNALTSEDCKTGIIPYIGDYSLDCGTKLLNENGKVVAAYSYGYDEAEIQIGQKRYPAKIKDLNWEGENFQVKLNIGKTLENCLDSKGERKPECESISKEVDVALKCGGAERRYEKWRLIEGC